jgi:hypothetical protein
MDARARSTGQHFLRGPIPWWWIARAAVLPGRAFVVGLAVWFWVGMTKASTVRMSCRGFPVPGISRFAIYRGLLALERAQLVTVQRRRGHAPLVTIQVGGKEKTEENASEEHG